MIRCLLLLLFLSWCPAWGQAQETIRVIVADKRVVSPSDLRVQLTFRNSRGEVLHNGEYRFDANLRETIRQEIARLRGQAKSDWDALNVGSEIAPASDPQPAPAPTAEELSRRAWLAKAEKLERLRTVFGDASLRVTALQTEVEAELALNPTWADSL